MDRVLAEICLDGVEQLDTDQDQQEPAEYL